jgi:protein-L-isoaspartate(D-aspartate) O-methyltransferase
VTEPAWIDRQLRSRGISDERVLAAMARVPRELFVPEVLRAYAYDDGALPLAHGQTVSQPFMVAVTCQGLGLKGDERVLDVGTGSGYAAAVLAELAAAAGAVRGRADSRWAEADPVGAGAVRPARARRRVARFRRRFASAGGVHGVCG